MGLIKYYTSAAKPSGQKYLILEMPKEILERCNLGHKDTFNVSCYKNSIKIEHSPAGNFQLSKNGGDLVININSKHLGEGVYEALKIAEKKAIPFAIEGNFMVLNLLQTQSKPKGFNLYKVVSKGFGLTKAVKAVGN